MKSLTTWLGVVLLAGLVTLLARPVVATAQDEARPVPPPAKMTCCAEPGHCAAAGAQGCPMNTRCARMMRCLLSILAVIHVMLAVWVYTDIRKRGDGHGIFIILALLGGIPATILYALVRIGDRKS